MPPINAVLSKPERIGLNPMASSASSALPPRAASQPKRLRISTSGVGPSWNMYERLCTCDKKARTWLGSFVHSQYIYICVCVYVYVYVYVSIFEYPYIWTQHTHLLRWRWKEGEPGFGHRRQVSATDALRAAMKEAAGARIFQRGNVGRFYGSIYCVNRLVQRHHLNPDISDYIFPSTAEAEEVKAPYKEPDEAWLSETWAGSWQKLKKELAMGGGSLEHWCFSRWCVGFWIAWTWAIWLLCRSWHVAHARLCSTEGGLIAFVTTLRQDLAVVADMLHIAAYAQQGWWGGLITFLTPFRGTCCRRCWNVAHARLCSKGGVEGW